MFNIMKVLPVLGKAIQGDVGGALNEGMKAIGLKPSGDTSQDKKSFENAVKNATPEQLQALKKIEYDYKIQMAKLEIKEEKVHADDRNSARERHMTMKDRTPSIIGISLVFGFFALLGILIFTEVPIHNQQILNIMLGSLGTMTTAVVTYYFGSSSSSAKKDEMLRESK